MIYACALNVGDHSRLRPRGRINSVRSDASRRSFNGGRRSAVFQRLPYQRLPGPTLALKPLGTQLPRQRKGAAMTDNSPSFVATDGKKRRGSRQPGPPRAIVRIEHRDFAGRRVVFSATYVADAKEVAYQVQKALQAFRVSTGESEESTRRRQELRAITKTGAADWFCPNCVVVHHGPEKCPVCGRPTEECVKA